VLSHHAAQLDVRKSVADPAFDADVNLLGTLNLLAAAREVGCRGCCSRRRAAPCTASRISSLDEAHPHHPISPYGITKSTGEHYLAFFRAVHGIPYVALRYSNVYGPRQDPHGEAGVVAIFCQRLLAGEIPTVFGDGKQTRDYVFVGDVVRANVAALASDFVGAVNIGTGVETDVNELCEHLRVLLRLSAPAQARARARGRAAAQRGRDRSRARGARLAARGDARRGPAPHGRVLPHAPQGVERQR
jgi:UDP-glucose 4-epimerase